MKRLLAAFDGLVRGWVALFLAIIATGVLIWWIGARLPWQRWPNVFAIFTSSWLYLIIAGAICMTAAQSALRRGARMTEAVACLVIGLGWHKFLFFVPMPFDIRWVLITYGLAGLGAACLMRARVKQLLRGREAIAVPPHATPPDRS